VKFPERFWTKTISRLSVAAEAALVHALLRRPPDLPPGVFLASAAAFEPHSRYAWSASQIEEELAAADGIAVDSNSKLAVVWEVALANLPTAPMPARGHGRRVVATGASWMAELAKRTKQAMSGSTRVAFEQAVEPFLKPGAKQAVRAKPRPRGDDFNASIVMLKRLERELRSGFHGVTDLGDQPSIKDRLEMARIMAHGVELDDIVRALHGRAEKCRRSRVWQGQDTAEKYLRLSWICATRTRFDDALGEAPAPMPDTAIVRGPGGTFVGGRQICEPDSPAPIDPEPPADIGVLDDWLARHGSRTGGA